jgi:hypothetical protein
MSVGCRGHEKIAFLASETVEPHLTQAESNGSAYPLHGNTNAIYEPYIGETVDPIATI